MPSSETELAWAAGFFDGEGGTFLYHKTTRGRNNYQIRMQISQSGDTLPEVLVRFKQAVGGLGKIYGPYKSGPTHKKPVWSWRVATRKEVELCLEKLRPFLCSIKIEQADYVLYMQENAKDDE